LFDIFINPGLPSDYVHKIGEIIREAAEMVASGEMDSSMQTQYVTKAVKEYLGCE